MKKLNRILLASVAAATLGTSVAWADTPTPRVERRQARQHERIHQGGRSGQLTPPEMRRLHREEMRLRRMKHRLQAEGRVLRRERLRLHRELDRQSRMIWRFRHNGRCYVY